MYQQLSPIYNQIESYCDYPIDRVFQLLSVEPLPLPIGYSVDDFNGQDYWYCFQDESYYSLEELQTEWTEIIFDLESCQNEKDGFWHPFLAMVIDQRGRTWKWQSFSKTSHTHVPFPINPNQPILVLGHNIVAYDSKYFSYYQGNPVFVPGSPNGHPYIFLDTLCLAQASLGLSDDSDSKSKLVTAYLGYKKRLKEGIGIPNEWFSSVTMCNLSDLHQFLCGSPLNKTVRDDGIAKLLADDLFVQYQPATLIDYCYSDLIGTLNVAKQLIPYCTECYPSLFTWQGVSILSTSHLRLTNWKEYIEGCEKQNAEATLEIQKILQKAVDKASPELCPLLNWAQLKSGKNKGQYKWFMEIQKSKSFLVEETVYLLNLHWDNLPIYAEKRGKSNTYRTKQLYLPHPSGDPDANLGSPFSVDYRNFAASGKMTSTMIEQDDLVKIFDLVISTTQWVSYRKRYSYLLHQSAEKRDFNIRPDICPIGTITARTSSPIWTVLPKPKEKKIGNAVWKHITTPYPDHIILSADCDTQESEIACLFTDAMAGHLISNEWVKIVLFGEKENKTDIHNVVAKFCGIPRDPSKNLNFSWQYSAGVTKQCQFLVKELGITFPEAEVIVLKFISFLSGINGIALSTVRALDTVAKIADFRLPMSGRLICNALNAKLTNDFFTNRRNFSIQSTGSDFLHCFIAVMDYFIKRDGLDAYFLISVHDRFFYSVHPDHADQLYEAMQQTHLMMKRLAYQTFWLAFRDFNNHSAVPDVLDNKKYFSGVEWGTDFSIPNVYTKGCLR